MHREDSIFATLCLVPCYPRPCFLSCKGVDDAAASNLGCVHLSQLPCLRRPGLLLADEFKAAEGAKLALLELFPDADVDMMVEQQPLLLIEDIEVALAELTR